MSATAVAKSADLETASALAIKSRATVSQCVQRRPNGLRVSGLLSSGGAYAGQYGSQGYQNRISAAGDLNFRCNVDYRGQVTNVRVRGNNDRYRG